MGEGRSGLLPGGVGCHPQERRRKPKDCPRGEDLALLESCAPCGPVFPRRLVSLPLCHKVTPVRRHRLIVRDACLSRASASRGRNCVTRRVSQARAPGPGKSAPSRPLRLGVFTREQRARSRRLRRSVALPLMPCRPDATAPLSAGLTIRRVDGTNSLEQR